MIHHFANMVREVEVTVFQTGSRVNGEWEPGNSRTDQNVKMIAIPITPAQVKQLPEGKYATGDMRFYHKGARVYNDGDIVTFNEVKYELGDISDRSLDGNFTMYLGRMNYDQSGQD